jgi:hypothetical protein
METKILKFTAILLIMAGAFACEKENVPVQKHPLSSMDPGPNVIQGWSEARYDIALLNQLECLETPITLREEFYGGRGDRIVGTWKLLLDFSTGDTVDYSCKSVLYTFDHASHGILSISSDADEIPSTDIDFDYGESPDAYYSKCRNDNANDYEEIPNNPKSLLRSGCPPPLPNLVISGYKNHYCQIAWSWMVISYPVKYGEEGPSKREKIFCKVK